jgi:TPP-dependent pyruvate/acetoin dehydrogenase alpha subunit
MQLIRGVEVAIEGMHKRGQVTGSFHSSVGQEAAAVGVCSTLRPSDIVTSTHRGHGHAIAKGVPVVGIFAELLGKSSGISGGRGGSMHLHHRPAGFYGENAIVGGGVPWAAGAAWARRRRGRDDVSVAFIGDGAFAQGATHESLLLARYWSSPCLIVCENNGLAHSMSSSDLFGEYGRIAATVAATGIESRYVDGSDVLAVADEAAELVALARSEARPAFLECGVFRVRAHSISDAEYLYRPKTAGLDWLAGHDPILALRRRLAHDHQAQLDDIDADVSAVVAAAIAAAEASEATPADHATAHVYATAQLNELARA